LINKIIIKEVIKLGIKKYLSLDKLDLFYEKLKAKMSSDNTSTLDSAKAYTDAELLEFAGEMNEAIGLINTAIEGKADTVHTHTISQVDGLQAELNSKEAKGSAEAALSEAKSYTDTEVASTLESANSHTNTKIAELINGAPTTLDTLGEIATAFAENKDVVEALNEAIGSKANATHGHAISDVTNLQTTLDGKENKGSASNALAEAKSYTDTKVADAIASLGVAKTLMETLPLQTATIEGQTEFAINFDAFDASTDKVLVQSGITMLYQDADYTVSGKTVILSEGVPLGRTIGMYVFKDVVVPYSEYSVAGSTIVDGSITKDKLSADVQSELTVLKATVDELKAHLGI
jgi:hypothetical protein